MTRMASRLILVGLVSLSMSMTLAACAGAQPDVQDATDAMTDLRMIIVRVCTQPPMIEQALCDRAQLGWNKVAEVLP